MPDVSQSLHAFYLWHIKRTCKRAGPGTLRNLLEIELGVDYICPIVLDKNLRHDQYRDDLSDEIDWVAWNYYKQSSAGPSGPFGVTSAHFCDNPVVVAFGALSFR